MAISAATIHRLACVGGEAKRRRARWEEDGLPRIHNQKNTVILLFLFFIHKLRNNAMHFIFRGNGYLGMHPLSLQAFALK